MIQKKATNYLLNTLIKTGFNPSDFTTKKEIVKSTVREEFTITLLRNPQLSFIIRNVDENTFESFQIYQTLYNPLFQKIGIAGSHDLAQTADLLQVWLTYQVREYILNEDELDYWDIIQKHPIEDGTINFEENTAFNEIERAQIRIGFIEIKHLLAENFALTQAQIEATNQKLDLLVESTNRLHKSEWKSFAINAISTIATELMLDDQKRANFFNLFSKLWAVVMHLPEILK